MVKEKSTARKTIDIFWGVMSKDKKSVALYSTFIPLNRLINYVLLPLLFSFIVQSLIQHPKDWQHPTLLLVIALVAAIVSAVFANIGIKRQFIHEEHMSTILMKKSMDALMHHSDQFFANRKVGSIAGDVTNFSRSIIVLLDAIYLNTSSIIVSFLASLIVIAVLSPFLLLPLGFMSIFLVIHSVSSIKHRRPLRNERKNRTAQLTGTIADILGNHQIVRFFASEKQEISGILRERLAIERVAGREIDVILKESFARQVTLFSAQVVTMLICIILFQGSFISIAALIFTISYLTRLTSSLFEITPIIRTVEQAFIDASNITDILDQQSEVVDLPEADRLKIKGGAVNFDNVHFSYKDSENDVIIGCYKANTCYRKACI